MKLMKFFAMALLAIAIVGCGPVNTSNGEKLVVKTSSNLVQIGVDHAYFLVYLDDALLSPDELVFFDEDDEIVTMSTLEIEHEGQTIAVAEWIPTQPETKTFWVAYKSYESSKNPVSITAVDFALPSAMEDPQPDNVSFNKRTFFAQFTGTGCGWCPFAKAALYQAGEDEAYADKFLVAAIYTYGTTELFYPGEYGNIETVFGVQGYPTVVYDMKGSFGAAKVEEQNLNAVKTAIDNSQREQAKAGIAVNVASDSGDTFVARVSVKAAVDGEFFVGAWLVEDDLEATQSNYGCTAEGIDFNHHNNVMRIADSGKSYYGHSLGAMKAGEIKDYVFPMTIKTSGKKAWTKENCRLIAFVSYKAGSNVYVTNCIGNDHYSESIAFDYK